MTTTLDGIVRAVIVGVVVGLIVLVTSGCAMVPSVAGYFTSGGVTLYKKANESGPKAEFVVLKLSHDTYITNVTGATRCLNCSPSRVRAKITPAM